MDIINKSKIFISIAIVLVITSWVLVGVFGLKPGIDLAGGTEWRVNFSENQELTTKEVQSTLISEYDVEASVKSVSTGDMIIRLPDMDEKEHQGYKKFLEDKFGEIEEKSFSSVGPVIGRELREKAIWAIIGVLIGITLFVAWAFRKVSRPINSWKYGVTALLALVHDVSIPVGMFAVLGAILGIEVGTTFIVALLVVLGFSVNDTIVVMDRIRENLLVNKGKKIDLKEIINDSINETIVRSINTSLTLVIVLVSLLVFGPESLFYFILTILVGTIFGTYSSIFVASPLLYIWGREA
ncbi:MAG TPA: protein translocase subunit SecF [Candidatus Paceibacterota bacterium]|nr:protein translocase subunit SecF [Candidatus Paceibacterota bacterium]